MKNVPNRHGVLFEDKQLGPFPVHRLKRVDKPTTLITDKVKRIDGREMAFVRAARGDYGPAVQKGAIRGMPGRYPISAAQTSIVNHLASFQGSEVAATKAPIPEDPEILSRHIKRLGYFLKADVIGICRVPEYAIYSCDRQGNPVDLNYQYAIVIAMGKEYQSVKTSTGYDWIGDPISFQAYQRVSLVAHTIADYIKRLGYPASPQAPNAYQVLIPPLLLWAGIGEVCRNGIILSPFLGLSFKAAAVLTDLPLVPDKPIDFGLQDFCQHCKICAELCPSQAILAGDKVMYNGYETWKLDVQRCISFSMLNKQGTICNRCVKVCPWTKPTTWPHNLVRWAVQRSRLARRIAVRADQFLGSGKVNQNEKWWFDLEEVDGFLRIPPIE